MGRKARKNSARETRLRREKRNAAKSLWAKQRLVALNGRKWRDIRHELPKIEHQPATPKANSLPKRPGTRSKMRKAACHYCGKTPAGTVDHVIPLSDGGVDRLSNLVPCCPECNQEKGSMPYEWFVAKKKREAQKFESELKNLDERIADAKLWNPDV